MIITSITDDLVAEIEVAARACGHGWYDTVLDTSDLFPDQDCDTVFVHASSPERILQLIRRMKEAEARLLSLALAATGADRQRAVREGKDAIDHLNKLWRVAA